MCGRYSFAVEDQLIYERFGVSVRSAIYKARYNCAPSQDLAVIPNDDPGTLSFYRWGLIPFWAKEPSIGNRMINARAETLLEKPSFKMPFRRQRCLVLSDGFYEWKKAGEKIPYRICLKDDSPFAMAGIWDRWKNPEGQILRSFSIITTSANPLIGELHDRMPVILERDDEKHWLGDSPENELVDMLKPYPSEKMRSYPVSRKVNSPANDYPEILVPDEG